MAWIVSQAPPGVADDHRTTALRDQDPISKLDVAEILAEPSVASRIVRSVEHEPGHGRQVELPNVIESMRYSMIGTTEQGAFPFRRPDHANAVIATSWAGLVEMITAGDLVEISDHPGFADDCRLIRLESRDLIQGRLIDRQRRLDRLLARRHHPNQQHRTSNGQMS